MKNYNLCFAVTIALLSTQTSASAAEPLPTKSSSPDSLILTIDAVELANHILKDETYISQHKAKHHAHLPAKTDALSKNLKKASKAFKRLTSMRYGKQQKIRAKLGKSSLTIKYTRIL